MRVMRVLTRPNLGGPTRQAAALYRAHAALSVSTLLVVGRCEPGEAALPIDALGAPVLTFAEALRLGPAACGLVQLDDLGRGLRPWRDRRALAALRRLMAAHRPDVVHTHTSKAGWLGRRAAHIAAVPVVAHTFHGHVLQDYFGTARSWLLTQLERRAARHTDLLFAVSASCAGELEALGVAAKGRIAVVPPAVEVELPAAGQRQRARQQLGLDAGTFVAVCAGRLVPIKRVADFVAAVQADPSLCGEVYGDGPLAASLQAAAGARLRFRGARADLPALLPAYDALVLSSRREGYPLVAIEAFAAGVPVVGYDVPGIADALEAGKGVKVPVAAGPAGLAAALQRLRGQPEVAARAVAAGRAALPAFAPRAVAAQLLLAYDRARSAASCYRGHAAG